MSGPKLERWEEREEWEETRESQAKKGSAVTRGEYHGGAKKGEVLMRTPPNS